MRVCARSIPVGCASLRIDKIISIVPASSFCVDALSSPIVVTGRSVALKYWCKT